MHFLNESYLLLLLIIPILIYFNFLGKIGKKKDKSKGIRYSDISALKSIKTSKRAIIRKFLPVLRYLSLALIIVGFARPQSSRTREEIITEGIDIMLALDVSSSMKALDFKPKDRLAAAKETAIEFIKNRQNDRIGLVVFSGNSFTQVPLTLDYDIVIDFIRSLDFGMIEDGTAIGMAIANCANRLRSSEAKSKVIILLTDGRNNRGAIDPLTAAQAAKALGIRIYTIGAGKKGEVLYPIDDPIFGRRYVNVGDEIDEDILTKIAETTGGRYFRAQNTEELKEIYSEIDKLEKTKIRVKEYTQYKELFTYFVVPALLVLLVEIFLTNTVFRKIP